MWLGAKNYHPPWLGDSTQHHDFCITGIDVAWGHKLPPPRPPWLGAGLFSVDNPLSPTTSSQVCNASLMKTCYVVKVTKVFILYKYFITHYVAKIHKV